MIFVRNFTRNLSKEISFRNNFKVVSILKFYFSKNTPKIAPLISLGTSSEFPQEILTGVTSGIPTEIPLRKHPGILPVISSRIPTFPPPEIPPKNSCFPEINRGILFQFLKGFLYVLFRNFSWDLNRNYHKNFRKDFSRNSYRDSFWNFSRNSLKDSSTNFSRDFFSSGEFI